MARGLPAFIALRGKAITQPERRGRIAAVLHEGEPFGVGNEMAGEFDRADQRAVRRLLIVEMKAVVRMADGMDAFVEGDPFVAALCHGREAPRRIIGRRDRVLREGV